MQAETPSRPGPRRHRSAAPSCRSSRSRAERAARGPWTRGSAATAPGGTSASRSTSRATSTTSRVSSPAPRRCARSSSPRSATSSGKRLFHLQCHFGLDTLSWARHGARWSALDFSAAGDRGGERARRWSRARRRRVRRRRRLRRGDGARRRALRHRLHRARRAQLAPRPRHAGQQSSRSCSRHGGVPLPERVPPDFMGLRRRGPERSRTTTSTTPGGTGSRTSGGTYADLEAQTSHNATLEWAHPLAEVGHGAARRGSAARASCTSTTTPCSRAGRFSSPTASCSARVPTAMPADRAAAAVDVLAAGARARLIGLARGRASLALARRSLRRRPTGPGSSLARRSRRSRARGRCAGRAGRAAGDRRAERSPSSARRLGPRRGRSGAALDEVDRPPRPRRRRARTGRRPSPSQAIELS